MNKRNIGSCQEERAARYLEAQGCRILERNFYAGRYGELDIIARDSDGTLVICECKYRSKNSCGSPLEAVDKRKQKQICRLTLMYYRRKGYSMDYPCRFDVIALYGDGRIEHIKNAFGYES